MKSTFAGFVKSMRNAVASSADIRAGNAAIKLKLWSPRNLWLQSRNLLSIM
jgi:hypothetical protein